MAASAQRYDVVIAGGGPAGFAAGLFTARYRLTTLILDRGKSLLKQCAYLDNFLGFPGGIDVAEFLALARAQVVEAGCEVVRQRVVAVRREAGQFVVETDAGATFLADSFIAATGYDANYLRALEEPQLLDEDGELRTDAIDREGRTIVEGLYAAGPIAGVDNQALISAGHGAQVALGLVRDLRIADGLWDALARHLDWQVRKGTYDTDRWARRVHEYFDATVPAGSALDEAARRELIETWIRRKREQQIARDEVQRRRARARRMRGRVRLAAEPRTP